MKKNVSGMIIGLIFVFIGLSIFSNSFGIFRFSIFFRGWWTLFIIVPSFIKLCDKDNKKKNSALIGLCIGIFFLFSNWGILPSGIIIPLFLALFFIGTGSKMIFKDKAKKDVPDGRRQEDIWVDYGHAQGGSTYQGDAGADAGGYAGQESYTEDSLYTSPFSMNFEKAAQAGEQAEDGAMDSGQYDQQGNYQFYAGSGTNTYNTQEGQGTKDYRDYRRTEGSAEAAGPVNERVACSAIFSGKSLRYDYETFTGGIFSILCGGIDLDLRHAIISNDVVIEAKVLMGGMDIILPDNIRVVVESTDILSSTDNKRKNPQVTNEFIPTIYIHVTCIMGGVDIK